MMLDAEELKRNINDIPPLPVAVVEAMRILESEEVNFYELQAIITKDAGLSSRVLSIANSPFYGMDGKVSSIKESCVILGTHTLRNIIIAAGMMGKFPSDMGHLLDLKELWRHSYATGVAASLLSEYCGIEQEKAFTAGLLHDIGKMVLDVYFQGEYMAVIQYCEQADFLLADAETHILGVDHAEIGEMIARRWNLPEEIVNAISGHLNV
ncbi:MAG: HDOD domain-containing protein, partial [Gammaproteobacteria bacterium]|nr:HDOD domain-containing protein [Gammaproteobacteria bacterium]